MRNRILVMVIASMLIISGFAIKGNTQYEQQISALKQRMAELESKIEAAEQRLALVKNAKKETSVDTATEILDATGTLEESNQSLAEDLDVENEVEGIREKYNDIVKMLQSGKCNEVTIDKDVTGYVSSNVDAIYVKEGYGKNTYSRKYYFSDGKLLFAYYEAKDAHRLYFKNDKLIRWRYSEDSKDAQKAINHDVDQADGYDKMEESAIKEAYALAASICDYSDSTKTSGYTAEDIERLYKNYIQAELTNIDISAIELDVSFSEDLYWVDTFQDNETDSMHPVKSGSAYIDPVTGKGKFWIWGWYDDPDAVDVDFSKYDY